MRALRSKHRFVLLIAAILLFQAISGFPQGQTNAVSYLSTNDKQKKSSADTKANEGAHLTVHPAVQSESILTQELTNEADEKSQRVGRASAMELERDVKNVIHEQLDLPESQIQLSASFVQDLGVDSLGFVELILALEQRYQIDIPDEEAEKIKTVQNAVDYVISLLNY